MAISIHGQNGAMRCAVANVPAFPGEGFGLGYPESIGDTARSVWFGVLSPSWENGPAGTQISRGEQPGELRYTLTVTAGDDFVDAHYALTNLSDRVWEQSHAFNCCQCGGADPIRDHDALRTFVGLNGAPTPLRQVPRAWSVRPTVNLYSVSGQPAGMRIPFVAGFGATPPDVALEGWMAIVADDGQRLVATASKPCLYLFQNLEYSCIHAACGFGRVEPGQTVEALNRTWFFAGTLDEWYARYQRELVPWS